VSTSTGLVNERARRSRTAAAYGILGTGPYRLRVFTSMHIQYQSFITKHYRIQIQSSVAFITVVHYSEIVFKRAAAGCEEKGKQENGHNQQKKKKKERKKERSQTAVRKGKGEISVNEFFL